MLCLSCLELFVASCHQNIFVKYLCEISLWSLSVFCSNWTVDGNVNGSDGPEQHFCFLELEEKNNHGRCDGVK